MRRLLLVSLLVAPLAVAGIVLAQEKEVPAWKKLRPDAPNEPNAKEYECAHPKMPEGWTPPSLEELEKLSWKDGRVADAIDVGKERLKDVKPLCSVKEALELKNTDEETNKKIMSVMCQAPKSDDEVDWEATLNRHGTSPNTLNPILSSSAYEQWMNSLHAAGPFTFDHEMLPFADADVVKRWRRSTDNMIELVELRDDLVWDDGTPFTAYDIDFSYHAIMDPAIPVTAIRTGTDELKWVKAYNATTIVYFHKEPLVTNVWNINFTLLPKHIYKRSLVEDPTIKGSEWHAYWNRNPLALGPYRLKEWRTAETVVFERREAWYKKGDKQIRKKPYFKAIRFRLIDDENTRLLAMKKGELDDVILTPRQWVQQTIDSDFYDKCTKVRGTEWTYYYLGFNQKVVPEDKPYFKDKRVRQALAMAFDHKFVLKKVFLDLYQPCVGPLHPDSPWGNKDLKPTKQNLEKAEALLDEAGWKKDPADGIRTKDGVKFDFTLLVPQGGMGGVIAESYAPALKSIGVKMTPKLIEWAAFLEATQNHKFEASVAAWGTGTDPDLAKNVWMTEMYEKGRNYVGYSNPRVDELFKQGAREFDFEKRRKIYQEISKIIYEDQGYLFIAYRGALWSFSKDVRGYNTSPRGFFSFGPGTFQLWKPKKTF